MGQRLAVIYDRISDDKTGEAAGVQRQAEDNEHFCARNGWAVIAHLTDNDFSASRYSKKKRPGYQRALKLVEAGEADTLVAWHLDRLWRQPKELEHLIDLAEGKDVLVATVNGEIDLATSDGRFMARILVGGAAKASDDMSRRIRRSSDQRAAQGVPKGGRRAFGFLPGNFEHDPVEAALIRQAAAQIIDGEALNVIARSWNAAKVPTTQGAASWSANAVRSVLTAPRNAGFRVHRGDVVGDAAWEPIIDRPAWDLLQAVLTDPRRYRGRGPLTEWSGLFVCGRCDAHLKRSGPLSKESSRRTYRCHRRPGYEACGGVAVSAPPLEAYIRDRLFDRVNELAPAVVPSPSVQSAELAALDGRMAELAVMFADGEIGRSEWLLARAGLAERKDAARRQLAAGARSRVVSRWAGKGGALRDTWDDLDAAARRSAIDAVIVAVKVNPATRPSASFDPNRVAIEWAE